MAARGCAMSGIAGVIDFSGAPIPEGLIDGMLARMAHRGQDGSSRWIAGPVALGHCMTHATPESLTETQPLVSADGRRVLVMDGRIDNWEELRRDLAMPGANDAALVLAAFEAWGEDYPSRLEGDYAIAIWDSEHQRLHAARDLFGKRPFYYWQEGSRFAFASEQGPLFTLPWVRQTLNEGMLAEWLGFEWYSLDETFWKGIYRLKPRHQARIDRSGIVQRSSWEPDIHGTVPCRSDAEFIEYYRSMLRDIVRRQSRSHRPLAFEVSGGLDSSSVYALGHDLFTHGELLAPGMQGYTLAFPPGTRAHEVEYARAVGRHCGTSIRECPPVYHPLAWYREQALARRDVPGLPNGVMQLGLYDSAKADGAVVVIGGYGGDEWTGQWIHGRYYADFLSARDWRGLYRAFRSDIHELGMFRTSYWLLRHGIVPLAPESLKRFARRCVPSDSGNANWLSPRLRSELRRRRSLGTPALTRTVRHSQRRFYQCIHHVEGDHIVELAEYHLAQRGMEMRSPFSTKQIVQFAFSTDEWMRHRRMQHRWLHREAMKPLLPTDVLERSTKAEFSIAVQATNDPIRRHELSDLKTRRQAWLDVPRFDALAKQVVDVEATGLENWVLWNAFCCDAVASGSCE